MDRTLPSIRPRGHAIASTRQRVAALLGLLALGLLFGHVHPAEESEAGHAEAPVVSDDHAHHEHSSHVVVDTAPCVACRSFDGKAIAPPRSTVSIPTDLGARALPVRREGAALTPFAGLPATRAPPIA